MRPQGMQAGVITTDIPFEHLKAHASGGVRHRDEFPESFRCQTPERRNFVGAADPRRVIPAVLGIWAVQRGKNKQKRASLAPKKTTRTIKVLAGIERSTAPGLPLRILVDAGLPKMTGFYEDGAVNFPRSRNNNSAIRQAHRQCRKYELPFH